jgi:hypothetical protein
VVFIERRIKNSGILEAKSPTPPKEGGMGHPLIKSFSTMSYGVGHPPLRVLEWGTLMKIIELDGGLLGPPASAAHGYSDYVNIQRRIIGQSVVLGRNGQVSGVDVDALVHRLLLFDGYVLRTVRFKEVPFLIKAFGYDQTIELLKSGLIEIRCEVHQIGSQRDAELKRRPKPEFCLVWVEAHNWDEYVATCLGEVQSELGLTSSQWAQLERAIRDCIRRLRWDIILVQINGAVLRAAEKKKAECL